MKNLFVILLSSVFMMSCSEKPSKKTEATKSSVYKWSHELTTDLAKLYPASFRDTLLAPLPSNEDNQSPLDENDILFLQDAGVISSVAEFCGLDWADKNYLPIMQWQREQGAKGENNGQKIAIIGALHGAYQGQADRWLNENDAKCTATNKLMRGNLFLDRFKF